VPAEEIERLAGRPDRRGPTLSARNRLAGVVRDVRIEGMMARV